MLLKLEHPEPIAAAMPCCPSCNGGDVRRSRRGGLLDSMVRLFGLHPYRCRACRSRYFANA